MNRLGTDLITIVKDTVTNRYSICSHEMARVYKTIQSTIYTIYNN